ISINCPTNDVVLYTCNSNCVIDPALFGSVTATNPCNPTNLIVTYNPGTNYCFPPGLTLVTVSAYAVGGVDSNTCSFYVDVVLETNPVVSLTTNLVVLGACSNGLAYLPDETGYVSGNN